MKNPNLGRNQGENNPMFSKTHSEHTKALMSESQRKRLKNINRLLFHLREDQLSLRIKNIIKEMQNESK